MYKKQSARNYVTKGRTSNKGLIIKLQKQTVKKCVESYFVSSRFGLNINKALFYIHF